jgi:hypothetical protein
LRLADSFSVTAVTEAGVLIIFSLLLAYSLQIFQIVANWKHVQVAEKKSKTERNIDQTHVVNIVK